MNVKDMLTGGMDSLVPRVKKKDLMKDENFVFHHHTHMATEFLADPNKFSENPTVG